MLFILRLVVISSCSSLALTGCALPKLSLSRSAPGSTVSSGAAAVTTPDYGPVEYLRLGRSALAKKHYKRASKYFNKALSYDVANSEAQFLNGLTYSKLAKGNPAKYLPLAEKGFKLASKFDITHWKSRYYLGRLHLANKSWGAAQNILSEAVLIQPSNQDLKYHLAGACYYAGDFDAAAAILSALPIESTSEPLAAKIHRAKAIIEAARGRRRFAEHYAGKTSDVPRIDAHQNDDSTFSRVRRWSDLHRVAVMHTGAIPPLPNRPAAMLPTGGSRSSMINAKIRSKSGARLAQFSYSDGTQDNSADPSIDKTQSYDSDPSRSTAGGEASSADSRERQESFVPQDMVALDVVIIGTTEDNASRRGINLLSGLRVQFGGLDYPALRYRKEDAKNMTDPDPAASTFTRTIIRSLDIPGISYSLNIFNTQGNASRIIAQPTVTALAGQTSQFFSGTNVEAAAASSGNTNPPPPISKDVGVKLEFTPTILPDGKLRLKILADRSFISTPNQNVVWQYRFDTTKTQVRADAVLNYGETLILSGLKEQVSENSKDAVPVLGDLPVADLITSEKRKRVYARTILIMVTPRRAQVNRREQQNQPRSAYSHPRGTNESVQRLLARFPTMFTKHSTSKKILDYIYDNNLFAEFRDKDFYFEGRP